MLCLIVMLLVRCSQLGDVGMTKISNALKRLKNLEVLDIRYQVS